MDTVDVLAPLQEVATVAAGNAATALSKLLQEAVTVAVPTARLLPIEAIPKAFGPSEQVTATGLVKIEGDANGLLVFIFSPGEADAIAQHIAQQHTNTPYHDADQSVLREVVNIIGGAALSSLGSFLQLQLWQSVPGSATDMLGAVIDPFIAELGAAFDKVLILDEVFTIPTQGASIKMIAIIDPPSTTRMLQKISDTLSKPYAAGN
jgi:chemotaxis protein CheC